MNRHRFFRRAGLALVAAGVLLSGCRREEAPSPAAAPPLTDAARLGERIFHDKALSASGRQSCASCHDPANGHSPANTLAVQVGGPGNDVQGMRAAPSLRYLSFNPEFRIGPDGRASGGYNRDGRDRTMSDQARHPLLAAHEMANGTKEAAVARLRQRPYAAEFARVFGDKVFANVDDAFAGLTHAVQQYQRQHPDFRRFDAKYDAWLAGKAGLSAAEERGMKLFAAKDKGNCAACHAMERRPDGGAPLFTDFGYAVLGVPRNRALPANADAGFYDLGLCGPERTDLRERASLCGAFKVPTLRNVALRKSFFHNGAIGELRAAVRFHVRRDTDPQLWYPAGPDGRPLAYDDLPPGYRANVERRTPPFDRGPGGAPALSEAEIDDVVAFLRTLDDGWKAH